MLAEGVLEQMHHQVRMGVGGAEDQGLVTGGGVEFARQVVADDAVE